MVLFCLFYLNSKRAGTEREREEKRKKQLQIKVDRETGVCVSDVTLSCVMHGTDWSVEVQQPSDYTPGHHQPSPPEFGWHGDAPSAGVHSLCVPTAQHKKKERKKTLTPILPTHPNKRSPPTHGKWAGV
jgi:hypothetical protein